MQGLHNPEEQAAPRYAPADVLEPVLDTGIPRVLLVDDDENILRAMQRLLRPMACDLVTAHSGEEALSLLHQHEMALVICDEHMPGMKGTDLLKEALDLQPDSLRILMTGHHDLETVVQAINVGQVSQYLFKPWDDSTLRQTVATCIERYQLIQENKRLQQLIYSQHQSLSNNHDHLKYELKLGSRIHEVLLLSQIPKDITGLNIDAMTVPSQEIDGDFYDFYRPLKDIFDVVIGDVMGKGLPAALVGTAVKTQLMRFAVPYSRGKICEQQGAWRENLLDPEEILQRVHAETAPSLIDLGFFVSLFYARFNLRRHTLAYVDCGSTKPLHYQHESATTQLLKGSNFPIGMVPEDYFLASEVPFEAGDIFVFYSDGVTEARTPEGQLFGVDRLQRLIEDNATASPSQLLRSIRHSVVSFAHKDQFDDDLTVIIIKIGDDLQPRTLVDKTARFAADLSQLEAVREFIQGVCSQAPGDHQLLSQQLCLAVNEAFCNSVQHAYEGGPGDIIVHAELGEEGIFIELSDQGKGFDPREAPEPSLAGDRDHNFGLFILRQVSDVMNYVAKAKEDGWNHLRLFKRYYWEKKHMEFTQALDGNVLVITLEGNSLDAREAPQFKDRITDLISNQRAGNVVFDLQHLKFIDSSGLGSLLSVLKHLNAQKGDLKLASVPPEILTMFEIVRMHKLFEIHPSRSDAVKSFG